MSWNGEDMFKAVLLGSGGSSGGGSSGGGIPQADIDAAFAALAEKGVTVPDGATSADLDDLIASIVTGGGGGKTAVGTITFAEQLSLTSGDARVEHGLGAVPLGYLLLSETTYQVSGDLTTNAEVATTGLYMCRYSKSNGSAAFSKWNTSGVYKAFAEIATETEMPICFPAGVRIAGYIPAGTTVTWVAWA